MFRAASKKPSTFATGTWHKVHMEMVGDTVLGQVDDLVAEIRQRVAQGQRVLVVRLGLVEMAQTPVHVAAVAQGIGVLRRQG